MIKKKVSATEIELSVARYFSWRINLIVPNVSWGLWLHECDLLVVTKAGYCYEVEIKISLSDLKADAKKSHGHKSKMIRKLYFAIPEYLTDAIEHIPENAGILIISARGQCKMFRDAATNSEAPKLTEKERYQVARLGTMRIFNLKQKIITLKSIIREKNDRAL